MSETPESPHPRPIVRRAVFVRHLVLSVALWVTYVLYWRIVLARGVEREASFALVLLGMFVVLQLAFTQAWVSHNRRLARRHAGRRRTRPRPAGPIGADFLGRRLEAYPDAEALTRAACVVVRVVGDRKRFEAGLALDGAAALGVGEQAPPEPSAGAGAS